MPQLRREVVRGMSDLVEELAPDVDERFAGRPEHVQKDYQSKERNCSLQVPVLQYLAQRLKWPDNSLY